MPEWQPFACNCRQRYRIEGDLLFWDAQGDTTLTEMTEHMSRTQEVGLPLGFVGVIIDLRGSTGLSFAARKHAFLRRKQFGDSFQAAIVFIGGSSTLQTITHLMMSAMRLATGLQLPFQYTMSDAKARAMCDQERQRWLADKPRRSP